MYLSISVMLELPSAWYGMEFNALYTITRNGIVDIPGFIPVQHLVTRTVTNLPLSSPVVPAENIVVYFSYNASLPPPLVTDANIAPASIGFTITNPIPAILIEELRATVTTMTWAYNQSGVSNKTTTSFIIVGTTQATLVQKPDWIKVVDATTLLDVTTVINGQQVAMYPESDNTGNVKSDSVIFSNGLNNMLSVTVTQNAIVGETQLVVDVLIHPDHPYGSDDATLLWISGESGIATIGDSIISITFAMTDNTIGFGVGIDYNYEIFRNDVPVGAGVLHGVPNGTWVTEYVSMTTEAAIGDVIFVYLSEVN
jgi:hypothetical protein